MIVNQNATIPGSRAGGIPSLGENHQPSRFCVGVGREMAAAIAFRGELRFANCSTDPLLRHEQLTNEAVSYQAASSFICDSSKRSTFLANGDHCILLRGHLVSQNESTVKDVARRLLKTYQEDDRLDICGLDGSFSIVLLNSAAGEVLFFRNLVGTSNTYYTLVDGRVIFGSNLADLVRGLPRMPPPNAAASPVVFIARYIPGRETLFQGVFRVRPGEFVRITRGTASWRLLQTFQDLVDPTLRTRDAVDEVESSLQTVISEHAALDPDTVNFLSGGVDSTLLQALWKAASPARSQPPVSITATVDHAESRLDQNYAQSAAQALGTDHREVSVGESVDRLLTEHIALTGELPNHLQSVYFAPLSRAIAGFGFKTALCGEGADGLFGNAAIVLWNRARQIRSVFRLKTICRVLSALSAVVGKPFFSEACDLASHLNDQTNFAHPINQAGTFADWKLVLAAFGDHSVNHALSARRSALDEYRVGADSLARIHANAMLHEGIETATLWTTACNTQGVEVICPFLDSRVIRIALSCDQNLRFESGQIKFLLRQVLARHVSREIAFRGKLGFAQPVFEWLSPGGQLSSFTEGLERHSFLSPEIIREARRKPTWFLYSAACYDAWWREFGTPSTA